MNELNIERLNALGLPATVEHTRAGEPLITVRLPSGEIVAHGLAATHRSEEFAPGHAQKPARERLFAETDPSERAAATALLAVGHAAERVSKAEQDPLLSSDGRHQATSEAVTRALTAVGIEYARVSAEGERLAVEFAALHSVPQYDGDAAAAVLDGELRRDFASRSVDERAQLLRDLSKPEYRPLALALSRSPLPLARADAESVSRAWAAHVERAQPARTAALARATSSNRSATGLLKELSEALTRGFAKGGRPLDRMAVYQALKPVEGAWPVEFAAGERGFLEHQIAVAARAAEEASRAA